MSQAARNAAADLWRDLIARPGECIAERQIRAGGGMDELPATQAFARFEATIRAECAADAAARDAEIARLREALKNIADDCEADYPPSHGAIKYSARAALNTNDEGKD